MPSEAAKRRAAQKKAQKQASSRSAQKRTVASTPVADKLEEEEEVKSKVSGGATASGPVNGGAAQLTGGVAGLKVSHRSCTGI